MFNSNRCAFDQAQSLLIKILTKLSRSEREIAQLFRAKLEMEFDFFPKERRLV